MSMHRKQTLFRSPRCRETGLAAVEATIILPFLVMTMLVVAEVGNAIATHSTLVKRAESGARYLSDRSLNGGGVFVLRASKISEAVNLIVHGDTAGSGDAEVPLFTIVDVNVSKVDDSFLEVAIQYDYQPMVIQTLNFYGAGIDLAMPLDASVRMRAVN